MKKTVISEIPIPIVHTTDTVPSMKIRLRKQQKRRQHRKLPRACPLTPRTMSPLKPQRPSQIQPKPKNPSPSNPPKKRKKKPPRADGGFHGGKNKANKLISQNKRKLLCKIASFPIFCCLLVQGSVPHFRLYIVGNVRTALKRSPSMESVSRPF